jgi:hypothetical protein
MKTQADPTAARYRAHWRAHYARQWTEGAIRESIGLALSDIPANASSATILKDDGGSPHPDNAGLFFLHRIVR